MSQCQTCMDTRRLSETSYHHRFQQILDKVFRTLSRQLMWPGLTCEISLRLYQPAIAICPALDRAARILAEKQYQCVCLWTECPEKPVERQPLAQSTLPTLYLEQVYRLCSRMPLESCSTIALANASARRSPLLGNSSH